MINHKTCSTFSKQREATEAIQTVIADMDTLLDTLISVVKREL